ncbi:hypothetical protein H6501_05885 [Candidatus Woesearchaeota archaeon]|nr:hypothetical protein [Candidatus Woesearchaeota archaeon]
MFSFFLFRTLKFFLSLLLSFFLVLSFAYADVQFEKDAVLLASSSLATMSFSLGDFRAGVLRIDENTIYLENITFSYNNASFFLSAYNWGRAKENLDSSHFPHLVAREGRMFVFESNLTFDVQGDFVLHGEDFSSVQSLVFSSSKGDLSFTNDDFLLSSDSLTITNLSFAKGFEQFSFVLLSNSSLSSESPIENVSPVVNETSALNVSVENSSSVLVNESSSSELIVNTSAGDVNESVSTNESVGSVSVSDSSSISSVSSSSSSSGGGGGSSSPSTTTSVSSVSDSERASSVEGSSGSESSLTQVLEAVISATENTTDSLKTKELSCIPLYEYSSWSLCNNHLQTREVVDLNGCYEAKTITRGCDLNQSEYDTLLASAEPVALTQVSERRFIANLSSEHSGILLADSFLSLNGSSSSQGDGGSVGGESGSGHSSSQSLVLKEELPTSVIIEDSVTGIEYYAKLVKTEDQYGRVLNYYTLEDVDEDLLKSGILKAEGLDEFTFTERAALGTLQLLENPAFKISFFVLLFVLVFVLLFAFSLYFSRVHHFHLPSHFQAFFAPKEFLEKMGRGLRGISFGTLHHVGGEDLFFFKRKKEKYSQSLKHVNPLASHFTLTRESGSSDFFQKKEE